jgi:zinc transport system substrate-binding protein
MEKTMKRNSVRSLALSFVVAATMSVAPVLADAQALAKLPVIAVSVLPQADFVKKIAGDRVNTLVLVGPGADPHSYELLPRQMAELSNASIWFIIGVQFENSLVPKIHALYPKLWIVDTTKNVKFRSLDPGDTEDLGGHDPHVWLGPDAVKAQITVIRDALIRFDPANTGAYEKGYNSFVKQIDSEFASLAKELAPIKGKPVFVYHPAFGYFFDYFGLKQEAVEVGGKEPTQKEIVALIEKAKKEGAKVIFVEKQFPTAAADTLAQAIGGTVVVIDPLALDWLRNIQSMGDALKKAVR